MVISIGYYYLERIEHVLYSLTLGEVIVEAVVEDSEVEVCSGLVHGCDEHPRVRGREGWST